MLPRWQAAYRTRSLSPVEVAKATMDRAQEVNADLNAFAHIDRDGALAAASASERRWKDGAPLSDVDGVPTTLKDIVWVEGWSVRYGSTTTPARPSSGRCALRRSPAPGRRGLHRADHHAGIRLEGDHRQCGSSA